MMNSFFRVDKPSSFLSDSLLYFCLKLAFSFHSHGIKFQIIHVDFIWIIPGFFG